MGAILSQQGCLKLSESQGLIPRENLVENREYSFTKPKHRLYMLDVPMDLLTDDWRAIAKIVVTETTIGHGQTSGKYNVVKIYTDEESRIISKTIVPYTETQA